MPPSNSPSTSPSASPRVHSRPISRSLALIAITTVAGLAIRFAHLGLPFGISKYGGSALWALLVYWMVSAVLPRSRPRTAALVSAGITAAVELFKLLSVPWLDAFRMTLPGMLLLGRHFSPWDILAYWLAILAGMLLDRLIRNRIEVRTQPRAA